MAMKSLIGVLFAAVASFALIGCGDEEKPKEAVNIYSTVDECKGEHSETDCTQAFEGSQKDHEVSAPHMTLGQCVDAYGPSACLPRNNGEYFVPAMAGFALGMAVNSVPIYHPIYVDLGGHAYYHSTAIGTYHPNPCYGCARSTTVVHVYPQARSWSQSYARTPIPPAAATAKPSPPSYNYGAASAPSERGGFAPRSSASAPAPAAKTTPAAASAPPSAPSERGGFVPRASASTPAPASKTYTPPASSTPSYSAPKSYSSPPSSPSSSNSSSSSSRGGFSSGRR